MGDRDGGRELQMWRGLGRYKSLWCKLLQWWCFGESGEVTSSWCVTQCKHAYTSAGKHTATHACGKLREHLDTCHLPRGSHLVYTQYWRGYVSSWMCNLHASLHHWERMEDEVESEERANQTTHCFAGIRCERKHACREFGQETERIMHQRLLCGPLSGHPGPQYFKIYHEDMMGNVLFPVLEPEKQAKRSWRQTSATKLSAKYWPSGSSPS